MKNSLAIIFLALLVAFAFYFLGKKNGSNNTSLKVVQNVSLISEIAELSALQVSGNTNINSSNKSDKKGMLARLKNYLGENTINISIPYDAKYGVDMKNQKVKIDTKDSIATIYLPAVKLLSLQLRLDKLTAVSKTGLFASATIDDVIEAQKVLYTEAVAKLEGDQKFIGLAQEHIKFILEKYYQPLGLKVNCVFENKPTDTLN